MSDFHRGTRRFDDVEAASFSPDDTDLTVTEDGGDWVAKDTAGNVVLRYDEAAGDWVMGSLNTDEEVINGPFDPIPDSNFPLQIKAAKAVDNESQGIALQGYDDGSAGANTDKAPIRWFTTNLDTNVTLAQIVSHQIDNHLSFYTRAEPIASGNESAVKRLDIGAGAEGVPVDWRNINSWQLSSPAEASLYAAMKANNGVMQLALQSDENNVVRLRFDRQPLSLNYEIEVNDEPAMLIRTSDNIIVKFNDSADTPEVDFRGSVLKGLREVGPQPSGTDLSFGEWAFTQDRDGAGQASWLYKDTTGTVHYLNTDGTI